MADNNSLSAILVVDKLVLVLNYLRAHVQQKLVHVWLREADIVGSASSDDEISDQTLLLFTHSSSRLVSSRHSWHIRRGVLNKQVKFVSLLNFFYQIKVADNFVMMLVKNKSSFKAVLDPVE